MQQLGWSIDTQDSPVLKVPLQFNFQPVQILSKQLTKLNSTSPYRIYYLGPRWGNSYLFHKMYSQKHGYSYDLIKVNRNNNFFSQSMTNNQFYRNQIYYRAFEGMNPTLDHQNQIIFDSKFQSGNLDCVVKVGESEYDLFLRIDSNTRGHLFWFYFTVTNAKPGQTVKFNICNLTKSKSLYQKSFKPYVYRQNLKQSKKANQKQSWTQQRVKNVTYTAKKFRYDFIYQKISKIKQFYQLSFMYTFSHKEQIAKFAYCIPYTYTDLYKDLKQIENIAQIKNLDKSLTGVDIPLVKIGSDTEQKRKPIILITGRIHPGQSNGSVMLSSFMRYLCFSPQVEFLRKKVIFLIIPMLNPDGVIIGNSRTGASGKDLNRQFKSTNNYLFPQVNSVKKLVRKVLQTHEIDMYLDFHGHSRKKNLFIFGPHYNITQVEYYKSRIFPKLMSGMTPIFRYFGSNFSIPQNKKTTGRAIMFNQFKIPFVYTIQCSVGLYRDYNNKKDLSFYIQQWQKLSQIIALSLKQYYQGIDQYENFIEQKKQAKIKIKNVQKINKQTTQSILKKSLVNINKAKDLKIIKIFQQIKAFEQKGLKRITLQQDDSDGSSDSHNQDENLQKMKMRQFQGMITEGVQYQNQINSKNKKQFKSVSLIIPIMKPRQRKINKKDQMLLMQQFMNFSSINKIKTYIPPRNLIKSQRNVRQKKQQIEDNNSKKIKLQKICKKKQIPSSNYQQNIKFFAQDVIHYSYRQDQNKKEHTNKANVTVYNFSKMIQNPKATRYYDYQSQQKFNYIQRKKNQTIDQIPAALLQNHTPKLNYLSLTDNIPQLNQFYSFDQRDRQYKFQESKEGMRNIKNRNAYPASFYRIKYQAANKNKKKKLQQIQKSTPKKNSQFDSTFSSNDGKSHNFLNIKRVNK